MLLFVLIWPFQTSPFEVCPLFFLRGGERKIIYLHHLPSVKVMSFWHFSRRMWLSLYVLHCVTSHCFLHCCNIILTLFFVLFCFLHLCNNLIFFLLLRNGFCCWHSRDSSCWTIKSVSQKRAAFCHHCGCVGEGRNVGLSKVQVVPKSSKHLFVSLPTPRNENPPLWDTAQKNTFQLIFHHSSAGWDLTDHIFKLFASMAATKMQFQ